MADEMFSGDSEKSLYLIQIRYLEEELDRCQLRRDDLESRLEDLSSQYGALDKDKRDTTKSLKRSLAAREQRLEELRVQLQAQQRDALRDAQALQLQHQQELQGLQQQADELRAQVTMQASQMERRAEELTERLADVRSLEAQLVRQREEHEAAVRSLREEAASERRRTMEDVREAEEDGEQVDFPDLVRLASAQYREKMARMQTGLSPSDNESVKERVDVQLDQVTDLQALKDRVQAGVDELQQKSRQRRKEVEQQKKELRQQKWSLKQQSTAREQELVQTEALRAVAASATELSRQKKAEEDRLELELRRERSRTSQLQDVLQGAAAILRHVLMESEEASETQWRVQRLLDILESPAPQGPVPKDPSRKSSPGQRPKPPRENLREDEEEEGEEGEATCGGASQFSSQTTARQVDPETLTQQ